MKNLILPPHNSVSHLFWTIWRFRCIHNTGTEFHMYKTAVWNAEVEYFHTLLTSYPQ